MLVPAVGSSQGQPVSPRDRAGSPRDQATVALTALQGPERDESFNLAAALPKRDQAVADQIGTTHDNLIPSVPQEVLDMLSAPRLEPRCSYINSKINTIVKASITNLKDDDICRSTLENELTLATPNQLRGSRCDDLWLDQELQWIYSTGSAKAIPYLTWTEARRALYAPGLLSQPERLWLGK